MQSYSSGEVAKFCDVTSRTVIRWISSGKLNAFKLPGRGNNRIAEKELLNFLKENAIPLPAKFVEEKDRHCVVLSQDNYFSRHAKRIIRDADFDVHVLESEFEAGLEIARLQPSFIVLDAGAFALLSTHELRQLAERLHESAEHHCKVLIIGEKLRSSKLDEEADLYSMSKPIDFSFFSDFVESLS
jgi:excisionase family DNA binding protein